MTLLKTSLLNGIAVIVRILTALGLNKVLALYVGPAGYALIGQFSNAVLVASSATGCVFTTGVIKYTAEYFDAESRQFEVWRAAARLIGLATLLTATVLVLFREYFSVWLLGSSDYQGVFVWLAAGLPLLALNGLLVSIMNGRKEVRSYVIQNISTSVLGAVIAAVLAYAYSLTGALIAFAINQSVVVVVSLWLCRGQPWLSPALLFGPVPGHDYRRLLSYAAAALTTAIAGPACQIGVRHHLMETFGQTTAGEWQAVFKISDVYLMFLTTTLSIYYLPRLAEIREHHQLINEIRKVYRVVLPAATAAALAIYLLRGSVTTLLFSPDFQEMTPLFKWQLVGDVLKIGSWVLAYVMVGRAMIRWLIATEIIFSASWVFLTIGLTGWFGRECATAAFALNYALYWAFMAWLISKKLKESRI